ncbi:hypothetical protein [Kribbella lupini]|uniref:Zinc ribbon protein n=1 Tax=Kribbella lupini TaxID=291602 RepID=A0ABN2B7A8_9ACTN
MSAFCTVCGNRRTETTNYCAHCEAGFEESRPTRKTEAPAGHEAAWFVGATVALAVFVVVGILGANAVITDALTNASSIGTGNSHDDESSGDTNSSGEGNSGGDVSFIGPDGFVTPGYAPSSEEPPTWSPAPTEDETSEPSPEPTLGNELVSVAPEASQHPAAAVVVDLMTTYFTAINNHDYLTYQSQQTPAAQKLLTRPNFAVGFRSTVNSDVNLVSVTRTTDGRLLAKLTFTSNQDAADGPQGQTCTRWTVAKYLKGEPPTLLIDKAPKSYKSTHTAC